MYASLVLKRVAWMRNKKYIYVYLVLKRVAHANWKEIFVYLVVLKRVFWVEKKAMYHLHCSTCNPSGMEGNVHFASSEIVFRKWSGNRSGKQHFIHWCILTSLESVLHVWKYTVWCILTSFESVLHVWNGKRYIIYLPRSKACFPSGTESNVTFPSF